MLYVYDVLSVFYTNDANAFTCTVRVGPLPEDGVPAPESQWTIEPYTFTLDDPYGYSPRIRQIIVEKNMEVQTPSDWTTPSMWFPNTPATPTAVNNNGVGLAVPLIGIDLNIPLPGGTVDITLNGIPIVSAKAKTPTAIQSPLNTSRPVRYNIRSARVTDMPAENKFRTRAVFNLAQVGEDANLDQIIEFTFPKTLKNNFTAWMKLAYSRQT